MGSLALKAGPSIAQAPGPHLENFATSLCHILEGDNKIKITKTPAPQEQARLTAELSSKLGSFLSYSLMVLCGFAGLGFSGAKPNGRPGLPQLDKCKQKAIFRKEKSGASPSLLLQAGSF